MLRRSITFAVLVPATALLGFVSGQKPWRVTERGIGPLRVGMSVAQASRALGAPVTVGEDDSEGCAYAESPALPAGVSLMVIDRSIIARVDVDTTGVLTAAGVGVGSTEAEVLRHYAGKIRVEPHPYDGPEGHNLVYFATPDTSAGIIFETDGERVWRYRAGRQPEVRYIEGCL